MNTVDRTIEDILEATETVTHLQAIQACDHALAILEYIQDKLIELQAIAADEAAHAQD
jgi:hypothetical protein